jgi:pyrroline-5-carboxylate reductase
MDDKIGIIGYGSMGKMLFDKLVESGKFPAQNLYLANRSIKKIRDRAKTCPGLQICDTNADAACHADILFVCVKPLDIKHVLQEIANVGPKDRHIVSFNASVRFRELESVCSGAKISKAIPSVTGEVSTGNTLVCHNDFVHQDDKSRLSGILSVLGDVTEAPEDQLGIASELTSCMPGFIAALFKTFAVEAKKHTTLSDDEIRMLLSRTIYGTGKLLSERDMSFDDLLTRVATKGGITEEGAKVIYAEFPAVVDEIFKKTIEKRTITTEKAIAAFNA